MLRIHRLTSYLETVEETDTFNETKNGQAYGF
jgi:hypothetical protein